MDAWQSMMIATGLTAIRVFAERAEGGLVIEEGVLQEGQSTPAEAASSVARVVVAGTIATFGFMIIEQFRPELARGLGVLVLTTSVLVNGVALADIARKAIA